MYKTIVVPLDGSQLAEEAVSMAARLARRDSAALRLVCVHDSVPMIDGVDLPIEEQLRTAENDYIKTVAGDTAARFGIQVSGEEVDGAPAEMIARYAATVGADLVVMTTHGRTGFSRLWLGSVADGVMHHVNVPVLMLRSGGEPLSAPPRNIVVPTDGSPSANAILPRAMQLGGGQGCRYLLTRVVQPVPVVIGRGAYTPPAVATDDHATEAARKEAEDDLLLVVESLRRDHPHVDVRVSVTVGSHVARELLGVIEKEGADVTAIATHGRGVSRWAVGSVADKLLRGGTTAMLIWHPPRD